MWKRETEVMMVFAVMRAMIERLEGCRVQCGLSVIEEEGVW